MKAADDLVAEFHARRRAERAQRERDDLAETLASFLRNRGMNPEAGFTGLAIAKIRRGEP